MNDYQELRAALDAYDDDPTSSYARDCFYGNVDSDVIRALLDERDALREALDELANGYAGTGWDIGLVKRIKKARAALAQEQGGRT